MTYIWFSTLSYLAVMKIICIIVCILNITNCMNGGYPRWQSQYLRKLVMPDVNSIDESLVNRLLKAYLSFDMSLLNDTVAKIVSVPRVKSRKRQPAAHQLTFNFSI